MGSPMLSAPWFTNRQERWRQSQVSLELLWCAARGSWATCRSISRQRAGDAAVKAIWQWFKDLHGSHSVPTVPWVLQR